MDPDAASAIIRDKLRSSVAFDVELGDVRCFPLTNVLYLGLSEGSLEARSLTTPSSLRWDFLTWKSSNTGRTSRFRLW